MLSAVGIGGCLAKAYALQSTELIELINRAFPEIRWMECFVIASCLA